MKNKAQIKERIQKMLDEKKKARRLPLRQIRGYIQIIDAQVQSLRWAMGYKTPAYYWCLKCLIRHRSLACPQCGNAIEHQWLEEGGE